jgi:hypothetical protein
VEKYFGTKETELWLIKKGNTDLDYFRHGMREEI